MDSLLGYLRELELWNPRTGLVRAEGTDLVSRHLLDVLAAVPLMEAQDGALWADIGSGAGLPGIPLAIMCSQLRFLLVERSGRRAGFLRNAVAVLGLRDRVEVVEKDLERIDAQMDSVVLRAFRPFEANIVTAIAGVLKPGGKMYAYKGRLHVVQAEAGAVTSHFDDVRICRLTVPGMREERHLLIASRRGS